PVILLIEINMQEANEFLEYILDFLEKYKNLGPLPGILLPFIEAFFPFLPLFVFVLENGVAYVLLKCFLYSCIVLSLGSFFVSLSFFSVYCVFLSISIFICFCVDECCSIWIVESLFIFLDLCISRLDLCLKYCETTWS